MIGWIDKLQKLILLTIMFEYTRFWANLLIMFQITKLMVMLGNVRTGMYHRFCIC